MRDVATWLAVFFCVILSACIAVPLLVSVWKWAAEAGHRLCRCGAVFVALALALTFKGATKNIINCFSSDAGITVTAAEINVATNDTDITTLAYSYTGTNDVALPLFVRQSVSNDWEHLGHEWIFDTQIYENGTNTCYYFVNPPASNIVPYVMYYVGNDPPPVEIVESGGVEILSFSMTSKAVTITYAVDGEVLRGKVGTLHVESSVTDNVWHDLYTTNHVATVTNTLTGTGFFVGKTTKWRVRMEVGQ